MAAERHLNLVGKVRLLENINGEGSLRIKNDEKIGIIRQEKHETIKW